MHKVLLGGWGCLIYVLVVLKVVRDVTVIQSSYKTNYNVQSVKYVCIRIRMV